MAPSELLQQLAALARQDELRFEVDPKPSLTFQVRTNCTSITTLSCSMQASPHANVYKRHPRAYQLSGLHAR